MEKQNNPEGLGENKAEAVMKAITYILGVMGEMRVEGNIDSEPNKIDELLHKLNSGEISPSDAMTEADKLKNGRNER